MNEMLSRIERIWYLYNIGKISIEEYNEKKEKILKEYNVEFVRGE